MKRVILSALAFVAVMSGPALAADMPLKAPPPAPVVTQWTGFYLGINGGWAQSAQQWTATSGVTTNNFTGNGGLVGGTIGYNWQSRQFVLGVEGDFDASNVQATDTTTGGCAAGFPCTASVRSVATLRGRVGITFNQFLLYATGGAAFANIHNEQLALSPLATATNEKTGVAFGAGIEAMVQPRLSIKAEYLHMNFGQTDFCPVGGCGVLVVSDYTRLDIFRVGLNYQLGGGPLYTKY